MKKIIYFTLIAFFIMTGASFASWTVTSSGIGGTAPTNHLTSIQDTKASKNVTILVNSAAQSYATISSHLSGDKLFGVASGSSLIMVNTTAKTKGAAYTTAPTATNSGAFTGSNWSSM